jgi:hypothetical protein
VPAACSDPPWGPVGPAPIPLDSHSGKITHLSDGHGLRCMPACMLHCVRLAQSRNGSRETQLQPFRPLRPDDLGISPLSRIAAPIRPRFFRGIETTAVTRLATLKGLQGPIRPLGGTDRTQNGGADGGHVATMGRRSAGGRNRPSWLIPRPVGRRLIEVSPTVRETAVRGRNIARLVRGITSRTSQGGRITTPSRRPSRGYSRDLKAEDPTAERSSTPSPGPDPRQHHRSRFLAGSAERGPPYPPSGTPGSRPTPRVDRLGSEPSGAYGGRTTTIGRPTVMRVGRRRVVGAETHCPARIRLIIWAQNDCGAYGGRSSTMGARPSCGTAPAVLAGLGLTARRGSGRGASGSVASGRT